MTQGWADAASPVPEATAASLRPLAGSAAEIRALLDQALHADEPRPVVVQTSGSTGEAKRVALPVTALRASARATIGRLGGPGQWVLALPPHYVAGLQVLVRSILSDTTPVDVDPAEGLAAAVERLTGERRYLAAVPTQLHRWLGDPGAREALARLDTVLLGGAAAAPDLLARARSADVRVVTTYGSSETCGGCVYDGVPLDGVAVALGTGGEIRLAGPVLFDGYDGRPDLTSAVLRDGWLHTPDVGRFDDDGRLVVLGRADDVVVSGGVNVPLPAVEQRLATMPGLDQVAVLGRPDPEWGVVVAAVVVGTSSERLPSLPAIRDFVSAVHPREWAPRQVLVVEALPLLASGKVDRRAVADVLGDARPGDPATTHQSPDASPAQQPR